MRADTLPLVVNVLGAQGMGRGARVRVKLGQADLISLDIHGTVVAHLDDPQGRVTMHRWTQRTMAMVPKSLLRAAIAIAVDVNSEPTAPIIPP